MIKKMTGLFVVVAAVACMGTMTARAVPVPINGDISFGGAYTVDNPDLSAATAFTSFTSVTVTPGTTYGDYAGTDGASVTFTPFTFSPTSSGFTLWTFTIGPVTYSFDVTSMVVSFANANNLVVEGSGTASITGKDSTAGYWNVTANKGGQSFSFSSSASVPDGGSMLILFGSALSLLGLIKSRMA